MIARTMIDKIWSAHAIAREGKPDLLYIDLHFLHEVSSPQAFDGLRLAGRGVHRPDLTIAVEDHNVPTDGLIMRDPIGRAQVEALRRNCREFGIELRRLGEPGQGIVHVIGPETGLTQPGMTIVCGDSHTSTHGALGALAFGIGTSEVEHVLATQTLSQAKPRTMAVTVTGELADGVTAKDLALHLISRVGTGGGQGHIVEYRGSAIEALSIEARMTLCNMSIEWGARAGLVAPDEKTLDYVRGREYAPAGPAWDAAVDHWMSLRSDPWAVFDAEIVIDAADVSPWVTWGTNPGQGVPLSGSVPAPEEAADDVAVAGARKALEYMALEPGTRMRDIRVDTVFIGSCTNARIEDLRAAADVLRGRAIAPDITLLVVPGSMRVKAQAEEEGLDAVFREAGGEWRMAGCSMCLGLNEDSVAPGVRTASTSNRNFEGRQGAGARTHLVSPAVAAATAVRGTLSSPADLVAPSTRAASAVAGTAGASHEGLSTDDR
ncbi:3-isopropylmalate dehydratase large subunit [Microbacterium invictum]|uniref:3-isopropylmalate dehydratase large subunit n=1 Tax=Microbacterium invictum TaxID=515415 RepID=A0ABZ0VCK3_9MICO|nr:3-isopropylmalate dehydratase large subunit [Microbacterium invictum]WQB71106.1 3-isopropylmalate dehydratase large subunit [Microbacterium invictum]